MERDFFGSGMGYGGYPGYGMDIVAAVRDGSC